MRNRRLRQLQRQHRHQHRRQATRMCRWTSEAEGSIAVVVLCRLDPVRVRCSSCLLWLSRANTRNRRSNTMRLHKKNKFSALEVERAVGKYISEWGVGTDAVSRL